jgi:hypothetical protein
MIDAGRAPTPGPMAPDSLPLLLLEPRFQFRR